MQTFPTPYRPDASRPKQHPDGRSRGAVPPSGAGSPGYGGARPLGRSHTNQPGVAAALCYAVPLVPGAILLWRERENRFIRFHAAQSLIFFGLVAGGQICLYVLLLVAGGLITNDTVATVAAALIVLLFLALGVAALLTWFGLLADCIAGRARALPLVGAWAERLAGLAPHTAR